jgi:predicted transglutaminase-like cysteine proteinase
MERLALGKVGSDSEAGMGRRQSGFNQLALRALLAFAVSFPMTVVPYHSPAAAAEAAERLLLTNSSTRSGPRLDAYAPTLPPAGFSDVCRRYAWACISSSASISEDELLTLARLINRNVNRKIQAALDQAIYGVKDYWTLPESGIGDCEDYALMKKRELLLAGVPGDRLLLATALTAASAPHTVLVLRAASADYVLDNLRGRVLEWRKTSYTFLKMQDPIRANRWNLILLGPKAVRNSLG